MIKRYLYKSSNKSNICLSPTLNYAHTKIDTNNFRPFHTDPVYSFSNCNSESKIGVGVVLGLRTLSYM